MREDFLAALEGNQKAAQYFLIHTFVKGGKILAFHPEGLDGEYSEAFGDYAGVLAQMKNLGCL